MANQDYYRISDFIGTKPVQIAIGHNPDGDTRYRLDVTYSFKGEPRRRVWLTRTQLEMVHMLLTEFLYGDEAQNERVTESDMTTGNGAEPPF